MWHIVGAHLCTKIAKNWTFFEKKAVLRLFSSILGKIMGHMQVAPKLGSYTSSCEVNLVLHKNCKKLNFFSTFWGKSAQNLGNKHFFGNFGRKNRTYTGAVLKIDVHKNCTFFWTFSEKSEQNRRNSYFFHDFSRKNRTLQLITLKRVVQKIALFLNFFGKKCWKPRK